MYLDAGLCIHHAFCAGPPRGRTAHEVTPWLNWLSLPLAAGIICLIMAAILMVKIGGPLDAQILNYYFVLSPQWLLIAGIALVVPALALIATH